MTAYLIQKAAQFKFLFCFLACFPSHLSYLRCQNNDYLELAIQAERWIENASYKINDCIAWHSIPDSILFHSQDNPYLYNGSSGVILFYTELFRATGDKMYFQKALAGADCLLHHIPDTVPGAWEVGFYTGLGGIAYTLERCWDISNDQRYYLAAIRCLDLIQKAAVPTQNGGVQWGGINDIVYGAAGLGLYLLQTKIGNMHSFAKQIGIGLIDQRSESDAGWFWLMQPSNKMHMPNFSHGTAGVIYFLLRLHEETGDEQFLDAAYGGMKYLESITTPQGLIRHHEPGDEDLFYLGWCHGIGGTGKVYYKLFQLTGDEQWMSRLHSAAAEVMNCGIPEKNTPGFWNNVSICCGSAGLATFFLDLAEISKDDFYLAFAEKMIEDVVRKKTDGDGLKWVQAEHRVRPGWIMAQSGLMQGSAGIGLSFLRFHSLSDSNYQTLRFPDDSFFKGN